MDIQDHKTAILCPAFRPPFVNGTIWQLDIFGPFEYQTCVVFRWLLYFYLRSGLLINLGPTSINWFQRLFLFPVPINWFQRLFISSSNELISKTIFISVWPEDSSVLRQMAFCQTTRHPGTSLHAILDPEPGSSH